MAKTIGQLTELAATPDATDMLMISDSNVSKKISVSNLTAATLGITGNKTVADGTNLALGTGAGTKIGTATSQKLGFWNATPVDQPAVTADLLDSLQEIGVIASGAGDTPLNLSGGALTCGAITLGEAKDVAVGTSTGTKIGTSASQKIGFWNATPVVQPSGANQAALTDSTTGTAGATLVAAGGSYTAANINNNFATLNRLVAEIRTALVNTGIMKGAA